MKKKLLLNCIIALILSSSAFAQFQKGDKVLGLSLVFTSSKNESNEPVSPRTTKGVVFNISTELGFAVKENRLHGFFINGGYGHLKYEHPSQPSNNLKTNSYNVGAGYFTRNYKSLGKNFFIFGDGRAGFNYSDQKASTNTANEGKVYSVQAGIYPGVAYKLNNRFLLEVRLADIVNVGYSRQETINTGAPKNVQQNFALGTSLGIGYLNNISIGARWIIPSKRKA